MCIRDSADHAVMLPPPFGEVGIEVCFGSERVMDVAIYDRGFVVCVCFQFFHLALFLIAYYEIMEFGVR